ncbi:MAG TPA: hypothetical protein VFH61_05230 [Thermoleophilia bacterium]|nr:hypothetical protein [Thermoleophilia bacterium]
MCPHLHEKRSGCGSGLGFDTFRSLEHHLKVAHVEALPSEPFGCVTCDAEFVAQANWLDHMRDEHDAGG